MLEPDLSEESVLQSPGNMTVKTEQDIDITSSRYRDVMVNIKTEGEITTEETLVSDVDTHSLHVKEEIPMDYDGSASNIITSDLTIKFQAECDEENAAENAIVTKMEDEIEDNIDIKEEMLMGEQSLVSYDYPSFEDTGSMDSNDVAVLGNVETCLQEEYAVKSLSEVEYEDEQTELYHENNIKEEPEIVTETHLISNKVINTTSTITNPHDGLIESQTTKTVVMEILPIPHTSMTLTKIGNPEEILPTPYESDFNYDDSFQLNSITGNVLSLEQEAYGLLKAKKKVSNHSQKKYQCTKCPKESTSAVSQRKHMAVHKSIERRAMGIIKGLKTRQENRKKRITDEEDEPEIEVKIEVEKDGYKCTCGKVFQRRSRMETCLRSHDFSSTSYWHQCATCLKQFKDKSELLSHRHRTHRKKFQCKFCPTDYNTRKELFKHLQIHQKVQLMEYKVISEVVHGKQKLRCFMCFKSYSELSELKCHVMEDHKSPYICPNCKKTFPKIIEFANHVKTSHPEVEGQSVLDVLEAFSKLVRAWKCDECGLQFHEADKLALHQIEKHSPDLKADPQFQCSDCRRVFVSQKALTSHRRIHHSEQIEEAEPAEKGIMCLECRKICKDMDALTSHMRLHSLDRKYPCKYCDFRFATPEKRKTHSEIHTGDMKYVCFICEYQCSSENRLKQHKMSLKHVNMREFLLTGKPLIVEESTSKPKLKKKKEDKKRGMKRKDSESRSDVICDICGDSFDTEKLMNEHKQTHPFIEFPNEDKPTRIFFK